MTETWNRIADWAHAHIEELAEEYAGVTLRGNRCPCPIHGGKNLNFSVKNGEGWFCHSSDCGGGSGVDLVAILTNRDRLDVLRELAPRAGVYLDTSPAARRGSVQSPSVSPVSSPRVKPAPPPPWWETECEALRADGMTLASAAEMHTLMFAALTLGPMGRAYLETRGFDPDDAHAYGFRSIESVADWHRVDAVLASNYLRAERGSAGLAADQLPMRYAPALVIPYRHQEGRSVVRFNCRTMSPTEERRYCKPSGVKSDLLFNLPALDELTDAHTLHLIEGEFNGYTLHCYGERAVSFGSATIGAEMLTALDRLAPTICAAGRLVLWFDDDDKGNSGFRKVCEVLARHLSADAWDAKVHQQRIKKEHDADAKDANDLHLKGELAAILENAAWRK